MRFEFIAARKAEFPVSVMCDVLKVKQSGYYAHLKRPESKHKKDDLRLKVHIRASHKRSKKTYGSPRIYDDLKEDGIATSRKRIARLMREDKISGNPVKKFKRTTDSAHDKPIAPNILNREFKSVDQPNKVWAADITYVWTAMGWLYLAIVIDLYSRRIVGLAIDDHMRTELVTDAFKSALAKRDIGQDLLHHSDRGSQYASDDFRKLSEARGITLSMSRKGDCWDNAVAESFFATLKKDLIHRHYWFSKKQAITAVNDYILDFYNRRRRHSALGNITPCDYERLTELEKVA